MNRTVKGALVATVLVAVATGCASQIETGTVIGKYYQEAYSYTCQIGSTTIMSGNVPVIIPLYGECWHNECYWLALRDDKDPKNEGGYCVTREQFDQYETGYHFPNWR